MSDQEHHDNDIQAAIEARVQTYTSRLLTEDQAEAWLPRLRELVLAVPPVDDEDAKGMLGAGVRFMADMAGQPHVTVDSVLDMEHVGRWSYRAQRAGMQDQTLRHYSARLHRLARVRTGLPGRMRGPAAVKDPSAPLSMDELDAVMNACRDSHVTVLAAAVVAIGAGIMKGEAVGSAVVVAGDRPVVSLADGATREIVPALWSAAGEVAGVVVPPSHWQRARAAADSVGVELSGARARQTFRVLALTTDLPVGVALAAFGLTKEALDKSVSFLPPVDAAVAVAALRGECRRDVARHRASDDHVATGE